MINGASQGHDSPDIRHFEPPESPNLENARTRFFTPNTKLSTNEYSRWVDGSGEAVTIIIIIIIIIITIIVTIIIIIIIEEEAKSRKTTKLRKKLNQVRNSIKEETKIKYTVWQLFN